MNDMIGALVPLEIIARMPHEELMKALQHKYIKRVPYTDSSGKKRYRYFYPSLGGRHEEGHRVDSSHIKDAKVQSGAAYSLGSGKGHLQVLDQLPDGKFRVYDDDIDGKGTPGEVEHLTEAEIQQKVHAAHEDAAIRHAKEVLATLKDVMDRAEQYGTQKQKDRARGKVDTFKQKHAAYLPKEEKPNLMDVFVTKGDAWEVQRAPKQGRGLAYKETSPNWDTFSKEEREQWNEGIAYANKRLNAQRVPADRNKVEMDQLLSNKPDILTFDKWLSVAFEDVVSPQKRLALRLKQGLNIGEFPEKFKVAARKVYDHFDAENDPMMIQMGLVESPHNLGELIKETEKIKMDFRSFARKRWEEVMGGNYEKSLEQAQKDKKKKGKEKKEDVWTYEELPPPKFPPKGIEHPRKSPHIESPEEVSKDPAVRKMYYVDRLGGKTLMGFPNFFKDHHIKNREEVANDPDAWKYYYESRGFDSSDEGTTKKPTFLGRYKKDIQEMWDKYGVVLVGPKKAKTIKPEVLARVKEELDHLNEVFPVRESIAKYGLFLSIDPTYQQSSAKLLLGQYNPDSRTIRLAMGTGTTFIHELFHALDYHAGKGKALSGKPGNPVSNKASSLKLNYDPMSSLKHIQYLGNTEERFARAVEQFSSFVFPQEIKSLHHFFTEGHGYWDHSFMHNNADAIAEAARHVGIKIRSAFLDKVKEITAKTKDVAKSLQDSLAGFSRVKVRYGVPVFCKGQQIY